MLDEPNQVAVIRGLRNGQRESWTALYDGYCADVWRYVARLIGASSTDVADVVQETFLAAARSASQFDADRGTLWAWLTGIAHHQIAAHWRQACKRTRLLELAEAHAEELSHWLNDTDEPFEIWEHRELADMVRATLGSMTADYAVILTAKYLDDQSLEQIAQQEGGTVDAMKSKLARARREFRTRFERMSREPNRAIDESKVELMKKIPSK